MASIENRSRFQVSVKNRDDLTKQFPHSNTAEIKAYIAELQSQGFKPQLRSLENRYVVRQRSVTGEDQSITVSTEVEAIETKNELERNQRLGIFIDYSKGTKTTFAQVLMRYLREEAPRLASFEIIGYKINGLLADAGLSRLDLGEIVGEHPNPHHKATKSLRKPSGNRMGEPSDKAAFIRKPFAHVVPDDFTDYIDARLQEVEPSTVDREIDIFSAVCRIAIDTWRIHVLKNPMDGVRRPRYYNERDRRLKSDEEVRLFAAAVEEDRKRSIALRLEELMADARELSARASSVYSHKKIVKEARERYEEEAKHSYEHVPLFETFIQFQLMTGARRSESLALTWMNLDIEGMQAFIPETKNGRPRKLPIRSQLGKMLSELPRDGDLVFPLSIDYLRKAWARICERAGFIGVDELHLHDLRHEAISRVAEAGSATPGGFSLLDLQHFSGHRDIRMLQRYAHLCTRHLAQRLDFALGENSTQTSHRGRRRLTGTAAIAMSELISATPVYVAEADSQYDAVSAVSVASTDTADVALTSKSGARASRSDNVVRVNFAFRRA